MKKLILSILIVFGLLNSGCSNKLKEKQKTEFDSGIVAEGVIIGKNLKDFTIKNQFDKPIRLTKDTKKIIFVCTKPAGHLVRNYLKEQDKNFLEKRDILFIADVSAMPSIIYKMFALPDFKKSPYSVLLLTDEEKAKRFKNKAHKDEVMIIYLDNKKVTKVKFISTKKDLIDEIY